MMNSIINELWYGNICPQESGIFNTPHFKELLGYIARHRKDLENLMTKEENELLEKMMDCRNEYDSLAEAAVFSYGFRIGAKLVLEILLNTNTL